MEQPIENWLKQGWVGGAVRWRWDVMVNQDHQGFDAGAMRCYAMRCDEMRTH